MICSLLTERIKTQLYCGDHNAHEILLLLDFRIRLKDCVPREDGAEKGMESKTSGNIWFRWGLKGDPTEKPSHASLVERREPAQPFFLEAFSDSLACFYPLTTMHGYSPSP